MKPFAVFCLGLLIALAAEILRVYFIMPFPGSQSSDTIAMAYGLQQYMWIFRCIGLLSIGWMIWKFPVKWALRLLVVWLIVCYGIVYYAFNYEFLADKMFY